MSVWIGTDLKKLEKYILLIGETDLPTLKNKMTGCKSKINFENKHDCYKK